jgi:chemotaxis protein histidine kinase CheA
VSDPQAKLRGKFRAALAERTRSIVSDAAALNGSTDDAVRKQLLGQLHTLKGEARMLGMQQLASLCHALEEQLLSAHLDVTAFLAVVDAVSLALAETTSEAKSAELINTAAAALGVAIVESDPSDEDTETHVAEEVARWMQVDASMVQKLGESLAALSVEFSGHVVALQTSDTADREAVLKAEELQAKLQNALAIALDLRLASIEPLLASMASHVRVLAQQRNKLAQVSVRAQGVRVEKDVLEALREPLLHLCTNAVAHGVESPTERGDKPPTASITITAESASSGVIVRVTDDGRGIRGAGGARAAEEDDQAQYSHLFEAGFSTHQQADEIAGRGVGLDVVKRNVELLGGHVHVSSVPGQGTTFSIFVPALLTQQDVVTFDAGGTLYGLSAHAVQAIMTSEDAASGSIKIGGEFVPVRSLSSALGLPVHDQEHHLIVLRLDGRTCAIKVSRLMGNFEVIRRSTSTAFRERTGVEASAQLKDGRLLLILSSGFLRNMLHGQISHRPRSPLSAGHGPAKIQPKVLVVDDSVVVRDMIAELLSSAGYATLTAENGVKGLEAIQRFDPDLVVSDIEMPEMDGFEMLRRMREISSTLPVILLTARSSVKDRQRASALGANAYVAKGEFQRDSLVAIVGRYSPKNT